MRVIVCGQARGGTSMVAGVLRILGIHMGDNLFDPDHIGTFGAHEDQDMKKKSVKEIVEISKTKDKKYKNWGWKDPFIIDRLAELNKVLRDSKFVYIIRDPVACALSKKIRQNMDVDEGEMAQGNCNKNMFLLCQYAKNRENSIMFSYEKCLINPQKFVLDLIKFLGIDSKDEIVESAINFIKPKYRTLDGRQEY